jgi:FKBP-type peptidyl-prolyl cis-trans isomerase
MPTLYDSIKVKYTYKLLSDTSKVIATFDREPTTTFYSRVVDYMHGMQVGLLKMQEGSTIKLYIPSSLAFGPNNIKNEQGAIIITPNSNLVVDVELIDIIRE